MMHYKGLAKLAAKEAKNRALLICETAGMLSLLGEKWAYSAQAAVTMTREATTDALGTVMRFDTQKETFAAQTLENAAAMWQALALTSWVAWDDD